MTPFQRTQSGDQNETTIKLSGYLNEASQFGPFVFKDVKSLNIDFTGVEVINSVGILHWITWIKNVQSRQSAMKIAFTGCPKVIVDQMNNIKGFLPDGAIVRSFAVAYRCESCKQSYSTLLNHDFDYSAGTPEAPGKIDLPRPDCPTCKKKCTEDFIEAKYLKFLQPMLTGK